METTIDYLNDELQNQALIIKPEQGTVLSVAGSKITLKITSDMTKDQLGLYEVTLAAKTVGARLHYHRYTDETFIVTKGTLTVLLADKEIQAEEGGIVYVPRFTPHGFANNNNEPVSVILLFNPGQSREGFFYGMKEILSEQPINPEKFLKLYNKYDSFPVDPENVLPKFR